MKFYFHDIVQANCLQAIQLQAIKMKLMEGIGLHVMQAIDWLKLNGGRELPLFCLRKVTLRGISEPITGRHLLMQYFYKLKEKEWPVSEIDCN